MELRILLAGALLVAFAGHARSLEHSDNNKQGIFTCLFEDDGLNCARTRIARQLDEMQVQFNSGRSIGEPISQVIEQTGGLVAEGFEMIFGDEDEALEQATVDQTRQSGKRFVCLQINLFFTRVILIKLL